MITISENKETLEYNGKTINVHEYDLIEDTFGFCEQVSTVSYSIITKFVIFPVYVNKKFRWFKRITIKQQLCFERFSEFDDGWSCAYVWGSWLKKYKKIDIL